MNLWILLIVSNCNRAINSKVITLICRKPNRWEKSRLQLSCKTKNCSCKSTGNWLKESFLKPTQSKTFRSVQRTQGKKFWPFNTKACFQNISPHPINSQIILWKISLLKWLWSIKCMSIIWWKIRRKMQSQSS